MSTKSIPPPTTTPMSAKRRRQLQAEREAAWAQSCREGRARAQQWIATTATFQIMRQLDAFHARWMCGEVEEGACLHCLLAAAIAGNDHVTANDRADAEELLGYGHDIEVGFVAGFLDAVSGTLADLEKEDANAN